MMDSDKNRPEKKHIIFLTNDDGFYSKGIDVLRQHLEDLADVFIVAPDRERSATSLSLTLHSPLRVKRIESNVYAVDGTFAFTVATLHALFFIDSKLRQEFIHNLESKQLRAASPFLTELCASLKSLSTEERWILGAAFLMVLKKRFFPARTRR